MKRCSVGLIIILAVVLGAVVVVESAHHGAHVVVPPGQPGPRTGPSYLYPDPITTPGKSYEQITQATIGQTICNPNWSTRSIRPDSSYTDGLKRRQLQSVRYQRDRNPAHFEEDHFIPLELGGHPSDEKNLWPEMWGTPDHPQGAHDRFDPTVIGAHAKD